MPSRLALFKLSLLNYSDYVPNDVRKRISKAKTVNELMVMIQPVATKEDWDHISKAMAENLKHGT
jgi:hypothetical protein